MSLADNRPPKVKLDETIGANVTLMNWKRLQSLAVVWSAVFVAAAILAVAGLQIVPRDVPGLVWGLHVLVAVVGFLSGVAATRRRAEIEAERWQRVDDSDLTSGEREHAHREAESQLKRASAQFVLVGVTLGGWLAYQLRAERPEAGAAATELLGGEAAAVPGPADGAAEALATAPVYTLSASDLLIATPLVAFALGMLWARRGTRSTGPYNG